MNVYDYLNNGDMVEVDYKDSLRGKFKLFFDKKLYSNEYGENMTQLIFQKKKEDLGRKDIAVVVHPEDIEIKSVNGMSFYDYKKEQRKKDKSNRKTERKISAQSGDNYGIVERDGRFYCPCGNGYSQKGHAKWNHKKHIGER